MGSADAGGQVQGMLGQVTGLMASSRLTVRIVEAKPKR